MAGHSGGPWGGGGNRGNGSGGGSGGGGDRGGNGGGRRPPEDGPQIPEIDELMKKGQEQLRVLMGGRGGNGNRGTGGGAGGGDGGPSMPKLTRGGVMLGLAGAVVLYFFASFYTVKPEEQGVELLLGKYYRTTGDGPHFAWWPLIRAEVLPTSTEQTETIGVARGREETGLMLTTDANIVDIDFQVVWNISDPAKFLFNIRDPKLTVQAASESVMREIIAASRLSPILNRDRGIIASSAQDRIQATLDEYESGIQILRVNLEKADPPREVIDSFREVQAAEQARDRLEREADAYANRVLAEARGEAAQMLEQAEGYRARVVNEAVGEASRFSAVLAEYEKAQDVTRRRLYLETMERVLEGVDKTILDTAILGGPDGSGSNVVPYLPLNELRRSAPAGGN